MTGISLAAAIRESKVGVALATLVERPFEVEAADLLQAAAAAAGAGFLAFSVWPEHLTPRSRPASSGGMGAFGGQVSIVESAMGFTRGVTPRFTDEVSQTVELAAAARAAAISVCTLRSGIECENAAVEGLAHLGLAASAAGLSVCLEFLPWTAVATLASAWALVERTGVDNVGLVLDAWHFHRQVGGPDYDLLEEIPGDRIHCVQISDAAQRPAADVRTEAMTARRMPGDGVIDFARLARSLAVTGAAPLYVAEVFNTALAGSGAARMAAALRTALGATEDR